MIGFTRVGVKSLFVNNSFGLLREIKPLCIFDLFIYPHYRGLGEGKDLLDKVLELEGKLPN